MSKKTFSITFVADIEAASHVLSADPSAYEDDVRDTVEDIMYDYNDMHIRNLKVKELG